MNKILVVALSSLLTISANFSASAAAAESKADYTARCRREADACYNNYIAKLIQFDEHRIDLTTQELEIEALENGVVYLKEIMAEDPSKHAVCSTLIEELNANVATAITTRNAHSARLEAISAEEHAARLALLNAPQVTHARENFIALDTARISAIDSLFKALETKRSNIHEKYWRFFGPYHEAAHVAAIPEFFKYVEDHYRSEYGTLLKNFSESAIRDRKNAMQRPA